MADLKSKRAFIIIADVFDDVARVVMCEAYKSEMTSAQGYVWFLPMWLNTTWYNTDYFNKYLHENVNCTTAEMIKVSELDNLNANVICLIVKFRQSMAISA